MREFRKNGFEKMGTGDRTLRVLVGVPVDDPVPIAVTVDPLPYETAQGTVEDFRRDENVQTLRPADYHQERTDEPVVEMHPKLTQGDDDGTNPPPQSLAFPPAVFGDQETDDSERDGKLAESKAAEEKDNSDDELTHSRDILPPRSPGHNMENPQIPAVRDSAFGFSEKGPEGLSASSGIL